jgi:hypothetical protein
MFLFARYGVLLSPDNLAGLSLMVDVFASRDGQLEQRPVYEGDIVMDVQLAQDGRTTAALWNVHDGRPWSLASNQPAPGDVVVAICPSSDLPYQGGALAVFAIDDSFVAANLGVFLSG